MITGDSQLRWVGPEKGVIHLATAAIVNAVWDLWAKAEGKPLWKLLPTCRRNNSSPASIFATSPTRLLLLRLSTFCAATNPHERSVKPTCCRTAIPPTPLRPVGSALRTRSCAGLCREALAAGWTHFKIKVGGDLADDIRRCSIIREADRPHRPLMMDANQRWDVGEAIDHMRELARFNPLWIEEPTSPDDVLGHAAIRRAVSPIGVATGEHCQNRVIFKQLMQAGAIDFCQIDSCRLGGVNEILAVLLMAAKFGIPVCPHAGGVGLCEYVQHLSMFDYICVSASQENRVIEFVDHLHEHFLDPVHMRDGRYMPPSKPGYSIQMKAGSLAAYRFPDGPVWSQLLQSR